MRQLAFCLIATALLANASYGENWPSWRGPHGNGVMQTGTYPTQWSPTENIAWRSPIPGQGGSTPIVWKDDVFITTGADGNNWLLCLSLTDGKVRWKADLGEDRGGKHRKGSGANPSAVTDGKHVYAYFRSGDLACVDFDGKVLWQLNLQDEYGEDTLWWDLGSSPVLTEQAVVVAVMQTGPSYLVAVDKKSGKVQWKAERDLGAPEEAAQSYTTPQVISGDGSETIYTLGADHLTAHDAANGEELWRVGGFNPAGEKYFRSIASPVITEGIIVCPYSRGKTLTGIRLSDHEVIWHRDDHGSDVPTPAAIAGNVYVIHGGGHFECLSAADGKTLWEGDLPRSRFDFTSSPIVAGSHIYLHREDGTTFVINREPPLKVIAENTVNEPEPFSVATPVPVDRSLLIRAGGELVRVGTPERLAASK